MTVQDLAVAKMIFPGEILMQRKMELEYPGAKFLQALTKRLEQLERRRFIYILSGFPRGFKAKTYFTKLLTFLTDLVPGFSALP